MVLDPGYAPPALIGYFNFAHAAVLLFFTLSGYVIGISVQTPASGPMIRSYIWRRVCRLTPVNTVAVILGLFAGYREEWIAGVLSLFFLQNSAGYFGFAAPLLSANPNLWSLHYEMVCYTAFIAVWLLSPRLWVTLIMCLAAGLAFWFMPGCDFIAHWATGLFFWFAGLALAWGCAHPIAGAQNSAWPAALLALIATRFLLPLHSAFARLGMGRIDDTAVVVADLAYLPPILWLLSSAAGLSHNLRRFLAWATCGPLLTLCIWRTIRGPGWDVLDRQLGLAAALVAVLLAFFPISHRPLAQLARVGAVSYALYALAAPLQHLIVAVHWFSGSAVTWTVRFLVTLGASFAVAWLFERRLPARRGISRNVSRTSAEVCPDRLR